MCTVQAVTAGAAGEWQAVGAYCSILRPAPEVSAARLSTSNERYVSAPGISIVRTGTGSRERIAYMVTAGKPPSMHR